MSVRFKFRSAVQYDSVEIQPRPSISVQDLRSEIIRQTKLNLSQDLDLVFSDAVTGQEYTEEDYLIPSGSSIIIKRVPARSSADGIEKHVDQKKDLFGAVEYHNQNEEIEDFDDFGTELCPVPEVTLSDLNNLEKGSHVSGKKANIIASRGFDKPLSKCRQLEASEVSDASRKGVRENKPLTHKTEDMEPRMEDLNLLTVKNNDLPSELKCSLCQTLFKEAVMIPCCQHSFCEKCISSELVQNSRCPKCLSTRCNLEDLLPNVSLRHAIDHFLESQIIVTVSDNVFLRYAPDGESGIQAKDVSCAFSVQQRQPDLPHSPSATGMGSNQINVEFHDHSRERKATSVFCSGSSQLADDKCMRSATSKHNIKCTVGEGQGPKHPIAGESSPLDCEAAAEFQGENHPIDLNPAVRNGAGNLNMKRRGTGANGPGTDKGFIGTARYKKGNRACYFCGSFEHLVRDCPAASSRHAMFQSAGVMCPSTMQGYLPPYWNAPPSACTNSFATVYGVPGMMPFNASISPGLPYAVSSYAAPPYGGLQLPSAYLGMASMAPSPRVTGERPVSNSEYLDLLESEKNWKISNENPGREQSYGDKGHLEKSYYSSKKRRLQSQRGEESTSCSGDSFTHKSSKRSHCEKHFDDDFRSDDHRSYDQSSRSSLHDNSRGHKRKHRERSKSTSEGTSKYYETKEQHKHRRGRSEKYEERKKRYSKDASSRHHGSIARETERKGVDYVGSRNSEKHHNHAFDAVELGPSDDQVACETVKDLGHSSKHSCYEKHLNNNVNNDRWKMVSDVKEDCRKGYSHHKRKKAH